MNRIDQAQARTWLATAVAEARAGLGEGGIPIGAALYGADGTLLGRGHNRRVQDDDPSMHDILAVLGSQHCFGIQFAEDGLDGLRLAEQNDVDLIVLDLNLPGVTGFDVCRRIRSAGIEIPIVMVSKRRQRW